MTIQSGQNLQGEEITIISACRWNGCGNDLDCCRCNWYGMKKGRRREYDFGGEYVLKQIYKAELGDDGLYEAYRKEARWYVAGGACLGCLPEVLDLRSTDDEISILMKHYQALSRREINMELLEKIMRVLESVHATEIPPLLKQKQHTA